MFKDTPQLKGSTVAETYKIYCRPDEAIPVPPPPAEDPKSQFVSDYVSDGSVKAPIGALCEELTKRTGIPHFYVLDES